MARNRDDAVHVQLTDAFHQRLDQDAQRVAPAFELEALD
jgi:hypothetical protein